MKPTFGVSEDTRSITAHRQRLTRRRCALAWGLWSTVFVLVGSSRARADDTFWQSDKALHYSLSAVIASTAYGVQTLTADAPAVHKLALSVSIALFFGVGKEMYDVVRGTRWSNLDFLADVLGAVTGAILAHAVCWMIDRISGDQRLDVDAAKLRVVDQHLPDPTLIRFTYW